MKTRTIFYDPEGILFCNHSGDLECEYLNTFMVFGGIPVQTIVDVRISD